MRRPNKKIQIVGGRVIDPASGTDETQDLKIEDGRIVAAFSNDSAVSKVDAAGLIVAPGLIDMHVHLREPGREDEETIETGARAAAMGGFTTIVCMPNTSPVIDTRAVLKYVKETAGGCPIDVHVVAAITAGLKGERLSDMGDLAAGGAVGFSDDGRPVMDARLMRCALEYSLAFDLPIISHAEDLDLAAGGTMNEGAVATRLGLIGIPAAAEEVMIAREIILSEMTGARLHLTHISTAGSVALVRAAKGRGARVTADCTPHHLSLTDARLEGYDANFKMNPPLRTETDRQALLEGLFDGTIDAIASDHAPHARHEKEMEIECAPFGTIGLQTTLPAVISRIVPNAKALPVLIEKLTAGPARILGLDKGTLSVGAAADITVIDPEAQVAVETGCFASKSENSVFLGETMKGMATYVIKNGEPVVWVGELVT